VGLEDPSDGALELVEEGGLVGLCPPAEHPANEAKSARVTTIVEKR